MHDLPPACTHLSASRRSILRGLVPAAAGAALLCPGRSSPRADTPRDVEQLASLQSQPFFGSTQAGIVTPRPPPPGCAA